MNFPSHLSTDERERLAYLAGHVQLADVLADAGGLESAVDGMGSAQSYLDEARGSFMPEDFMASELAELRHIIGAMRKTNASRDALQDLLNRMVDKRDEQARDSEHGLDLLRQADKALEL